MHYTGMAAATYFYHEGKAAENQYASGDSGTLITGAVIAAMSFLWISILLVMANMSSWFYKFSETMNEVDGLIKLLETEVAQSHIVRSVIVKYLY